MVNRIANVTTIVRPTSYYDAIGISVYGAIATLESVSVDCTSGVGIVLSPRFATDPPITLNNAYVTASDGSGISVGYGSGGSTVIGNVRVTADVDGINNSGRLRLVNGDIQGGYVGVRTSGYALTSIANSRLAGTTALMHGNSENTSVTRVSFSEFDGTVLAYDTELTCFQTHDSDLSAVACP